MARGFLNGAFLGGGVSLVALALLSVLAQAPVPPVPVPPVAEAPLTQETGTLETADARPDADAPQPSATIDQTSKPEVQAPEAGTERTPDPAATSLADTREADTPASQNSAEKTPDPETPKPVETINTSPEVKKPAPVETVEKTPAPVAPATAPLAQQTPNAAAPTPDTLAGVSQETTAPAALPQTGAASDLDGPEVETGATGLDTATRETPVVPGVPSTILQTPRAAPSVSVSTDPAAPPTPQVSDEIALSVDPVQPIAPGGDASAFGRDETTTAPQVGSSISVEPAQPQAPAVPVETQAFERDAREGAGLPDAETPVPPVALPDDPEAGRINEAARPSDTPSAETAAPQQLAQGVQEAPLIDREPVGTVANLAPEVRVNRLPSLSDGNATPETSTGRDTARGQRPVERFAARYDNAEGKPVMAIVLMDDGVNLSRENIGLPALRSFPYPISFAVDTSLPDAGARMAAYRAEGFEVLAMVDLPAGAGPQDAEVNLAVALEAVPEAVGVLEGVGEGLGTRDAAEQVTDILAQTGHGFITQNKGLNTVQKLAAKSGVPSAVVFRDFDSSQQTPTAIRRFLDQAAFRAGREGGVIMLGRVREDTISALLIWGLQDRADSVALVPVSAALHIN